MENNMLKKTVTAELNVKNVLDADAKKDAEELLKKAELAKKLENAKKESIDDTQVESKPSN